MCLFKNSFMLSEYIKETSCRHTEVPQTNRVLAVVRFAFISPVNLVSALRIRCTSTMYRNQEFGLLLEALALQLEIRGMAWLRELCSRKLDFYSSFQRILFSFAEMSYIAASLLMGFL